MSEAIAGPGTERVGVVVGVPTYRRPERLALLLSRLADEVRAVAELPEVGAASVVVVDNDAAASAEQVVAAARADGLPVRYVVEPEPGIVAARNRLLDEAGDARLLAFIDDDEVPVPGWLPGLVAAWSAYGRPASVAGRVLEEFDVEPDPWIVAGGFFRRRSLPTGTTVPAAGAGNLLLDLAAVRGAGLRFDPEFGLSGGEDTMFCRQLVGRGLRIVWCDEARIVDGVPPDRATRSWVLARAYRSGDTAVRVDLACAPEAWRRAALRVRGAVGGAVRVPLGGARWLFGVVVRDARHEGRGLRLAWRGAGMVAGSFGRHRDEYARTA